MVATVTSLGNNCFAKIIVLTSACPYSGGTLQSQCNDWLPIALSLRRECPFIDCPYKEKLLYMLLFDGLPSMHDENLRLGTASSIFLCHMQKSMASKETREPKKPELPEAPGWDETPVDPIIIDPDKQLTPPECSE